MDCLYALRFTLVLEFIVADEVIKKQLEETRLRTFRYGINFL
jgi:hypothetical protein